MELYIVRHGETFGNLGSKDIDPLLTKRGEEQARLLGERLSHISFNGIFASPYLRSLQTAWAVVQRQAHARSVVVLPQMAEYALVPDYAGQALDVMRQYCPTTEYPNRFSYSAETAHHAYLRAQSVLQTVCTQFSDGDRVLLSGHGCFNTFLLLAALDLPFTQGFHFTQGNCCVDRVDFTMRDGRPHRRVVFINDRSHLPKDMQT